MNFELKEEQKMIKNLVREFAEREIAPRAFEVDKNAEFPWDNIKKLAEQGFLGMTLPKEYGGAETDFMSHILTVEELSRVCASTGLICQTIAVIGMLILNNANEELRKKHIERMIRGKEVGAFALTEPDAGSDASSIRTTARAEGDEYVINGKKHFISNAGEAEVYVVLAKTGRNDISMFLVEKDTEGLVIGRREEKLGLRGVPMGELIFEECVIPKENLMGKEGEGLRIAMASLDKDRIGIGAIGIGIASAALDAAKEFAKKRKQFGQPIANFQAIQFMIADMSTEIDAARFLTYRGAYLFDRGERVTKEASMAKLYSSEMAMRVAINAMQIHGGYGCTKDYPIERYLRDAKMLTLMVGTSEMQRIVIARNEMK
ncbi:MAG: acyl-CoA dehydrogenase family protein [Candidatus Syntropharchaeia archaeon]